MGFHRGYDLAQVLCYETKSWGKCSRFIGWPIHHQHILSLLNHGGYDHYRAHVTNLVRSSHVSQNQIIYIKIKNSTIIWKAVKEVIRQGYYKPETPQLCITLDQAYIQIFLYNVGGIFK